MKYEIEYEPRIHDPVIVARFNSLEEAEAYMEVIKAKHPRGAAYHTIKENEDE